MSDYGERWGQTPKSIAECWEHFRAAVIPGNADDAHVERARRVFYAGIAFAVNQMVLLTGELDQETAIAHMDSWEMEIDEFADELEEGFLIDLTSERRH